MKVLNIKDEFASKFQNLKADYFCRFCLKSMKFQYKFQVAFLRVLFKKSVPADSILTITLSHAEKKLLPNFSSAFDIHQATIRKFARQVDLTQMPTFKFQSLKDNQSEEIFIKYSIKTNSNERVRSVPLAKEDMITEFQNSKKSIFQSSFTGEHEEIIFKIFLTKSQINQYLFMVTPAKQNYLSAQSSSPEKDLKDMKQSRKNIESKRPPNLNISKRNQWGQSFNQNDDSKSLKVGNFIKIHQVGSSLDKGLLKKTESQTENYPQKDTASLSIKSHILINSKTKGKHFNKEIRLNQFPTQEPPTPREINSPYTPRQQSQKAHSQTGSHRNQHEHPSHGLSIKMKIVIGMLIFGILFLVFDTLSDKSIKKSKKSSRRKSQKKQSRKSKPKTSSHHQL